MTGEECLVALPLAFALQKKTTTKKTYKQSDFLFKINNVDEENKVLIVFQPTDAIVSQGIYIISDLGTTGYLTDWLYVASVDTTPTLPIASVWPYDISTGRNRLLFFPQANYIGYFDPTSKQIVLYDGDTPSLDQTVSLPMQTTAYDAAWIGAEYAYRLIDENENSLFRILCIPYLYNYVTYGSLTLGTLKYVFSSESELSIPFDATLDSSYEGISNISYARNTNIRLNTTGLNQYISKPNTVNGNIYWYKLDTTTLKTDRIKISNNVVTDALALSETITLGSLAGTIEAGTEDLIVDGYAGSNYKVAFGVNREYGTIDSLYDYKLNLSLSQIRDIRSDLGHVQDKHLYLPSTQITLTRHNKDTGALEATYRLSANYAVGFTGLKTNTHRRIQSELGANYPTASTYPSDRLVMDIEQRVMPQTSDFVFSSDPYVTYDNTTEANGFILNTLYSDIENTPYLVRQNMTTMANGFLDAINTNWAEQITDSVRFLPDFGCDPFIITNGDKETICLCGYRETIYQAESGVSLAVCNGLYRSIEPCIIMLGDTTDIQAEDSFSVLNTDLDFITLKPSVFPEDIIPRTKPYWNDDLATEQAIEAQSNWSGAVSLENGLMACLEPSCVSSQYSYWQVTKQLIGTTATVRLSCLQNVPIIDSGYHLAGELVVQDFDYSFITATGYLSIPSNQLVFIDQTKDFTGSLNEWLANNNEIAAFKMIAKGEPDIYIGEVVVENVSGYRRIKPLRINQTLLIENASKQFHLVHPRITIIHT